MPGDSATDDFAQDHLYQEGVAGPMNAEQLNAFLASPSSRWLLKLSTIQDDGFPMIVPLWYQWDGQSFFVVGRKRSAWVQDVITTPRCAICIEEAEHPRIRKVLAKCTGRVVEGPVVAEGSKWRPIAEEMAARYLGPDGPSQLTASYSWERYLVELSPTNGELRTWQGADWAPRYFEPGQRPDLEARSTRGAT